jgi:putative MFS transporter
LNPAQSPDQPSPAAQRRGKAIAYAHPWAFWLGVLITTGGVVAQLPMYYTARDMHFKLAGMPVTRTMVVGMIAMAVGIGITAYSLYHRRHPASAQGAFRISALDETPLRWAHITLLLVMSAAITIDVMKVTTLAFIAPGAAAEYGLRGPLHPDAHALPIGLYPLAGITGTVLGSIIWGWIGDHIGRRSSILLSAIIFVATSTCGTMTEYWMNLITCFIMGLGVGGMLPIAFALMSETIPKRHRGWAMVLIGSDIAGAYIIVSWLSSSWASPERFGWRFLWLVGLPSGLFLLALNRWIPESPRFLILRGRNDEARAVMDRYGAKVIADERDRIAPETPDRFRTVVSRPLISLTAAVVLLGLSIGLIQYGFQQWMPTNLQRLGYSSEAAAATLRNAALIGFPLSLPIALLYGLWSSKRTVILMAGVLCAALAVFAVRGDGVIADHHLLGFVLVLAVWGTSALNAVLAAYAAEVYPTAIRARASGVSAGATKLGGVAILTLAVAAVALPSIRITAWVGLTPCLLAAVAVALFGPETRGKQLEQITIEELAGDRSPMALEETSGK